MTDEIRSVEMAAIGAAINNEAAARALVDGCVKLDFLFFGEVFEEISKMIGNGEVVDLVTLSQAMKGRMKPLMLASCSEACVSAASIGTLMKQLRNASTRRRFVKAASHISDLSLNDATTSSLLDEWERVGFEIRRFSERGISRDRMTAAELEDAFTDDWANPPAEERIPYPLESLQRDHGGYQRGELIFLGGYSGDGKSVMGLQFLEAACKAGLSVGYFSLEMPSMQVQRRLVAMGGMKLHDLKNRAADIGRVDRRLQELKAWKYAVHSGSTTPSKIRGEQSRFKYDVIIVDHLHRMAREGDRREALESHAVALKSLALDLDCAVVCLGQLSRARDGGFPMPSTQQIRDTAVIEHESDMAAFVYRVRSEQGAPTNEARFIVGKMRDGRSGYYDSMVFKPEAMRFSQEGSGGMT